MKLVVRREIRTITHSGLTFFQSFREVQILFLHSTFRFSRFFFHLTGRQFLPDNWNGNVHSSISKQTNQDCHKSARNADNSHSQEPHMIVRWKIYNRDSNDNQGNSRTKIGEQCPLICQNRSINRQLISQNQSQILKFLVWTNSHYNPFFSDYTNCVCLQHL